MYISHDAGVTVTVPGQNREKLARNDYTGTPVTTGAYVQLVAATAKVYEGLEIFDSSGQTLVLAFGAPGSEVDQFYIFPGGNGPTSIAVPVGTRISIKAVSANASSGEISVNGTF